MRKQRKKWETIFLGSKITADGDCSHEIKRCLLLGRKAMTNLDSLLKSRDITLPTKVRLVKGIVFPVVTYGCESWTIKEADSQKIDAFELWSGEDSWESLELSSRFRRMQGGQTSQFPLGNWPWIFTVRTDAEAKTPVLWPPNVKSQLIGKDLDAGKDWRQKEKQVTEDEMVR